MSSYLSYLSSYHILSVISTWYHRLLAFVVVLCLCTLGTSFAAAKLAKDTTTSEGKLVDSNTKETLATHDTADIFDVTITKGAHDHDVGDDERKLGNHGGGGGGGGGSDSEYVTTSDVSISSTNAAAAYNDCVNSHNVKLSLPYNSGGSTVTKNLCPAESLSHDDVNNIFTFTYSGSEQIQFVENQADSTIHDIVDQYERLKSVENEACDDDADCKTSLSLQCISNVCMNVAQYPDALEWNSETCTGLNTVADVCAILEFCEDGSGAYGYRKPGDDSPCGSKP